MHKTHSRFFVLALTVMALLMMALAATGTGAAPTVLFDSIPVPYPGGFPSLGYQATQTNEFGDHIQLVASGQKLGTAVLSLTNWACENDFTPNGSGGWTPDRASGEPCISAPGTSFEHPITLNLYNVDTSGSVPALGSLITSKTEDFDILFRPSSDFANCGDTRWYDPVAGACYNGYAFNITFDFSGDNITLPQDVIYSVVYNTQTYGPAPIGAGGPYNSLNVSLTDADPSIGVDVEEDALFWNTETAGWYADGGTGGVNIFRRDTEWTPYTGVIRLSTYETPAPVTPSGSTTVCDTGTVDIAIGPVTGIYGYEFIAKYDKTLVSATAAFDHDWFDIDDNGYEGPAGWQAECDNSVGECKFAYTRGFPDVGLTGTGTVATIDFTSVLGPVANDFDVTIEDIVLSDIDGYPIASVGGTHTVSVCGTATVSGKVSLQGRPWTPGIGISGTGQGFMVNLTNGTYGTFTATPSFFDGSFTVTDVKFNEGGTNYTIDADHFLYLKHGKTPLAVNGNVTGQNTRLLGGDANNDTTVSIADVTCVGNAFNQPAPWTCVGGSPDINADAKVNIQDLSITGGNFSLSDTQPW
jgi:hypothetical protein